jgi:hypothetical protein
MQKQSHRSSLHLNLKMSQYKGASLIARPTTIYSALFICIAMLACGMTEAQRQAKGPPIPPQPWNSVHVRDKFIDRIGEDGFYCRLPAPALVVADTPLFGEYEKNTDTIVSPDWTQLTPEGKAVFADLAGPGSTPADAEKVFELEAHKWILIVETVRWWEACKQLTLKLTPYQAELQATRVALAYWRETDPDLVTQLLKIADTLNKEPSRVPPEQDFPTYFNQHYQKVASGKEYLWIQSQTVRTVAAEQPELIVVQALKRLE